jgi:hypothetical protein
LVAADSAIVPAVAAWATVAAPGIKLAPADASAAIIENTNRRECIVHLKK